MAKSIGEIQKSIKNIQGNDGWKLSNFNENINLQIQKDKWAPCGISANDPQTNILILKLLKDKEKKTSKQQERNNFSSTITGKLDKINNWFIRNN